MCHFIWRLLRGILPTNEQLARRGLNIDLKGGICGVHVESVEHCFLSCAWVKDIWDSYHGWHLPRAADDGLGLRRWLLAHIPQGNKHENLIILTSLWIIWKKRNRKIFSNEDCLGRDVRIISSKLVDQMLSAKPAASAVSSDCPRRWKPLPHGVIKINCDGAFQEAGKGGLGVTCRNSQGDLLFALSKPIRTCSSIAEVESLAILEGLQAAKNQGYMAIQVETDAQIVLREILQAGPSSSMFGDIIDEIQRHLADFTDCHISYIPRACNLAADRLARLGVQADIPTTWISSTPDILTDVLLF